MEPICTVLLFSYNHASYFRKSIESVLAQKTSYPYQIYVFDDASTDGTSDLVREYAEKYPDIVTAFVAEKNQGAQTNMWNAYSMVKTKYCAPLETDDFWCSEDKLHLQIQALEGNPDCSFCSTNTVVSVIDDTYLKDQEGYIWIKKSTYPANSNIVTLQNIIDAPYGFITHPSSRLIRMSCVDMGALQNKETFLFDTAQFMYLMIKGSMYWIDQCFSCYVRTGQGASTSATAAHRVHTFSKTLLELNEDTDFVIWRKTYQMIDVCSKYWGRMEDQKVTPVKKPVQNTKTEPHSIKRKSTIYLFGFLPLLQRVSRLQTTKFKILGLSFVKVKIKNNKKYVKVLGIPVLKVKNS